MIDELARTYGSHPALLGEGEHLSYRDLAAQANRHARWAVTQGLRAGCTVGLLMPNRPGYAAAWLGVTRSGCAVALLNTNLVGEALLHSLMIAGASHVIVEASLLPALEALAPRLPPALQVWVAGRCAGGRWPSLEPDLARHSPAPLCAAECPLPAPADRALLIYTSGTTGLPKAAIITHARIMEWSLWFAGMMDTGPDDRMYDCLPMYHSVGGVIAIGAMLVRGGSVLIRAGFSARRFWDDVADGGCTIVQYIGELCRYLVQSPPHPKEARHRLRLACGNGMQGDVWRQVQERFQVPRVLEFYAATEGSVSLYNCEGHVGAIGRIPPFLAHRFPVALVRCDQETGATLRGPDGFAIRCATDEAGEAIGRLPGQAASAARPFDGYTDPAASAAKVLRDVFAAGDRWFRTGDLMRKDAAGFFYFVDRLGDTFRWKGENVSTSEVAAVLRRMPGVTDAVVFGVRVPGHEGRAGMVALTVGPRFDLGRLRAHLAAELPDYAQPRFVRLCDALDLTGTFKLNKERLVREGYADATDPVWLNDRESGRWVPCDAALIASIGSRRL